MASIQRRELKSGAVSFRVMYRINGRQASDSFDDPAAAERYARLVDTIGGHAARESLTEHTLSTGAPTLAEWVPRHIAQLTGVTVRTRHDYQRLAERTWLPILGHLPMDRIDREAVARTVNALDERGLSAKSIANARGLLSAVFNTAVDADHIRSNPCRRIRLPRTREEERRDERFLTYTEYLRLLACFDRRERPFVAFLFGTGLRWSEATALQVRDVALAGSPPVVRVTKAWKYVPGKGREIGPPKTPRSRRSVILGAGVVEAIRPLVEGREPDSWLFETVQHNPLSTNWHRRRWQPAVQRARFDPPPRIHDARHTHASWLIEMGATLEQVQDQLGHESILTTRKVYGHLQPAMRTAMYDYASRAMKPRAIVG